MPSLIHMVVCRDAVIDQATNIVSLHGLIEEAQLSPEAFALAKEQPVIAASPMAIYALLSWDWPTEEEQVPLELELRIRSPADKAVTITKMPVEPVPTARLRTIFNLAGFPLDGEGTYTFELYADEKLLGKVPFHVTTSQVVAGQLFPVQPNPS